MNMNLSELINEIISEWAYRCDDGMPNPKNQAHLNELSIVLKEMGLSHIKDALVENLLTEKGKTPDDIEEADTKKFTNPILNKIVKYKSDKGEDKEGVVGNLLRQPEDSPGRKAAEAMLPPEGSPERDTMNQELGGEGQPKKPDAGKEKGGDEKAGGGEADKAKQAQAMFDPKADPAMAARMDKEKEVQAKLAKDAEADKAGEKSAEAPSDKAKDEFKPIDAADVQQEIPQADPETFGGGSDIPDGIPADDLQKFNTDIDKVAKEISDAKERGEKAPNINLCDVTVPGTNLYCDDNLGIPRDQMPQFKGKPQPGTPAADMPVDEKGEVDTEPLFKKMLEDEGIKVVQTEVPADKLKATQSELVGDKVIGMMNALENDPNHPNITAPIYVSRDGYVIDGHHRWAAITAYNAKHPDNQIPMKVQAIDKDIKDAIPMCNDFAEKQGVAAKKADANNESDIQNVTSLPEPKPEDPEEKKNWFQKQKERIQQKIKVMKEAGKQFFNRGGHKPGSVPRRSFGQALVDKIKGIPKAVVDGIKHHAVMFKDAGVAIFEAGVHGGLGTIEDPETGERFNHDDHIAKDANGKKRYEKIPQYETDSHGHIIKDPETGKPMQKRHWLTGNLMTEDRPIPNEDMTEKQKELFYKSYQKEKKQIKAIVGTGKAIMITAAGAYGLSAAMGHAYTTAGQLMTSTAIELVPHTIAEGTVLGIGKAALYAGAVEMNSKAKLDEFGTKLVKTIGEFISGDKEIPEDVLANAMELYNNVDKLRENIDKVPEDEGFLKDYIELHDQIEKDGNETSDESPKDEPKMKEEHIDLANELMLEMIYGFIDEAKVQTPTTTGDWKLAARKGGPDGKVVYFQSPEAKSDALAAGSHIDVDKKLQAKAGQPKNEPIAGADLFGQDYKDARGGGEKKATKKSNAKVNYDDRVDGETSAKVEETYNTDTKFSEPGMAHEDRVKRLKEMKSTEINYVKIDDVYTAMGVQEGATKFPAKYMSVLTNALNFAKGKFTITDLTDAAGAGTLDSTLGELTTLMGATIQDPAKRKEFFDYLREQVKKGENKSALTIAWVNSAQDSCEAFHRKLKKDCPGGHEVQTNFWDIPSEAKAAGVKNYKRDKGKSTDINTMVDCIAKDGTRTQKWLQPSLKKNKKVNGFNSTTGRVFATTVLRWASPQVKAQYSALGNELDSYDGLDDNAPAGEYTITDKKGNVRPMAIKERKSQLNRMMRDIEKDFEDKIPSEANPTLAGERQANLHEAMEKNPKVVAERDKFLTDYLAMTPAERKKVCTQIAKDLNQKGDKYAMELMETLDTLAEYDLTTADNFDSALTEMGITNKKDRRKLNVALMGGVISTAGNKTKSAEYKKTMTKNSHDHSKAVLEYLISDNDNKKALLENISTQFPLKDLMEGKEWAILGEKGGGINLDRDTITKCLGADKFDDVVEKLVIVDYNGEPTLAYAADNGKRTIPIGVLNCRPDGIMYGSTWKLELSIHEGFADCCKGHDK